MTPLLSPACRPGRACGRGRPGARVRAVGWRVVLFPGLRLDGWHDAAVVAGLAPGPGLWPWPGGRLGVLLPGLGLDGWHEPLSCWPGAGAVPVAVAGGRLGVLLPGLWLDGWHDAAVSPVRLGAPVAGAVPVAGCARSAGRRPAPRPAGWGRRRGAGVFCAPRPGQSRGRLRGGDRGDGEGPGDVRGHLAKLGRQPDGARPELVGLPGGGFADRFGLLGRLPPYLLGLLLGPAQRVGLESRLPPDFFGFLLGGFADRVGVVQRLLLYPGRLAVGVREDPLRQPDGVSIPEATGILPDGVEQLGRALPPRAGASPRCLP